MNSVQVQRAQDEAFYVPDNPPVTGIVSPLPQHIEQVRDPRSLAETLGVPFTEDLSERHPSSEFLERVPISFARRHRILGFAPTLGNNGETPLEIAVADLDGWDCLDVLRRVLGRRIEPLFTTTESVRTAINRAYQLRTGQAEQVIESLDPRNSGGQGVQDVLREAERLASSGGGGEDLLDVASRAPVIKLVNLLLFEAVKQLASDVHVQPYEDKLVIRLRIDGVLFDMYDLPLALHEEMVSRIKVMGRMNIAEKRLPQDGRATVKVGDRIIDLRLSCVPTSHGERMVIRLLDKSARLYTLEELGMPESTLNGFRELIGIEHGLILVTGPTGSGKTTTLYAALQQLNSKQSNVITLEDPIEYQLPGVSQIQVSTRKGMTFASGLRSVLRQDPDILMVGEIRDHETAVLAIQSALTGHLVFSTLHTNDAASAVTRLLDLGIESYLVASSVVGVMAQRLVRRVCAHCAVPVSDPAESCNRLKLDPNGLDISRMRYGEGCSRCRQTGYMGRIGLFELLMVNDAIRKRIQDRSTAAEIREVGVQGGMQTLRDDGLSKVLHGRTTVEEVVRVTMRVSG